MNNKRDEFFESDIVQLWIEEGILLAVYKVDTIDQNTAKTIVRERISFTSATTFPLLADYSSVKIATKEARDYMATDEASTCISALAVQINSLIGKVIADFYLNISKPKFNFPVKVFNNREDAITWLKQVRKQ